MKTVLIVCLLNCWYLLTLSAQGLPLDSSKVSRGPALQLGVVLMLEQGDPVYTYNQLGNIADTITPTMWQHQAYLRLLFPTKKEKLQWGIGINLAWERFKYTSTFDHCSVNRNRYDEQACPYILVSASQYRNFLLQFPVTLQYAFLKPGTKNWSLYGTADAVLSINAAQAYDTNWGNYDKWYFNPRAHSFSSKAGLGFKKQSAKGYSWGAEMLYRLQYLQRLDPYLTRKLKDHYPGVSNPDDVKNPFYWSNPLQLEWRFFMELGN